MNPSRLLVVVSLLLLALPLSARGQQAATPTEAGRTWHRVIGILQYLQADYPAAVESQDAFEIAEQKSFMKEALEAARELGPEGAPFVARLEAVQQRVERATDPQGVSRDCGQLVEDLARAGGLTRAPRHVPDLAQGAQVFAKNCAQCHGADGRGDTELARTLEPAPRNFHDPEVMAGLTPYKAFNTTSFGVPGTGMPAFPQLQEDERWAVAFYLHALRHPKCPGTPREGVSLQELANTTDPELARKYGEDQVACLRTRLPTVSEKGALDAARASVEQAAKLGAAGDYTAARAALLDAYLNGVEPVEPRLRTRDPQLVQRIEAAFLAARVAAERRDPAFGREVQQVLLRLDEARRAGGSAQGFVATFWVTLFILLREGFEATIIVTALLAVLKKLEATESVRVVHAGWVSALVAGAVLYVFGRELLAGANREVMEGVVALLAVGMLLYAALWLNARAHMSKFMGELRQKMQGAIGRGSMAGLFFISFSAVLRESFETALFLQGLALDSPAGVAWGAAAGLVAMVALVLFVRRMGYVLPMKTLFNASTVLLVATAVMLLGKGLHALQEVGWLPLAPVPFVTVDFLGIYPDLVSLLPQVALALAPFVYRLLKRRQQQRASDVGAGAGA